MTGANAASDGSILFAWDQGQGRAVLDDPTSRWEAVIHTYGTVFDGNALRQFGATHRVMRQPSGLWEVRIERPGHPEPTVLRGDGTLPALIEAEGAIVILLPRTVE